MCVLTLFFVKNDHWNMTREEVHTPFLGLKFATNDFFFRVRNFVVIFLGESFL